MNKGPRKLRWLRWGLGLGLLVGAYFLFQDKIIDTQLRPIVERELTKAVHSPVSIGSIRGGITGNVVLNNVDLTVPGDPWHSHLVVEKISVDLDLLGLIFQHKPLESSFKSVAFTRPVISLVRNETSSSPSDKTSNNTALDLSTIPLPVIPAGKLSIRKGSFFIQAGKTPRQVLKDFDLDASTENGKVWGIAIRSYSPEAGSQGILRFSGSFRGENLKVLGKLNLEQWPLLSLGPALRDMAGWELLGGTIDAESPFVATPGRLWFDATTTLTSASLRSPSPIGVVFSQINGRAFIRPTELNVPGEIGFNVGPTPWKATGVIPFDARPLAVRTSTDRLSLSGIFEDLLKIKNLKVDGLGSATLVATGFLSDPSVQGTAQLGASRVGDWELDTFSAKAGYEKGKISLFDARGKLYGGQFQANGSMSLSGEPSAPVSLTAFLRDVDMKRVATTLKITGMEGRGDVEVHRGGTVGEPVVSATSQMALNRTLRNSLLKYAIKTNLQLGNQKLVFSASVNDKARLDGELLEKGDHWIVNKLSLKSGKKLVKLTGRGSWPKDEDKPIDLEVLGKDILLQELPFLQDQFPDITGRIDFGVKVAGTRKEPTSTVRLSSDGVMLGTLDPEPMEVSLSLDPETISFEKFEIGDIFSVSGKMGLDPESRWDLKILADQVPIPVIAEVIGWNNPLQPLEGLVTGLLRFSGKRKNPIVEAPDGIVVDSLEVGDWHADKVDALLKVEEGKLQIKKLKMSQGDHSFVTTGSWDTRLEPGVMSLRFVADKFQLGKGPLLSGEFKWEAQTGDPWWKNWHGSFSTADFSIEDLKNNAYRFSNFSMNASSEDMVLKGKIALGKTIYGSVNLDLSAPVPDIQASLRIDPTLLSDAPNLTQFLPPSIKVKGTVSGKLQLKKGTFAELPMEGTFTVTDGSIQNYDFDEMSFEFSGNKSKVSPKFTLLRDEAKYSLEGTLSSSKTFWDPGSQVAINGPFQNEKLVNLLALLGINTQKHKIAGQVNGNLTVGGVLAHPSVGFSVTGKNLRMDDNFVPSAELQFSEAGGKITLGKNEINLTKGKINVDQGKVYLDEADPSVVVMDILGATQGVPIAVFNLTSSIHLSGRLALEEKPDRPTFDGLLSLTDKGHDQKKETPFDLAISVRKKIIEFKPREDGHPQLVGSVDLSEDQKIVFKNLHLENSKGAFSVDGILDLNGKSQFTSDAKDVPIEAVGKWVLPKFPVSGVGSYHLIFEGGLDNPVFTTSISIANGKVGDLQFDLLDGQLKASDNVLYLGSEETPMELSRKGLFNFTVEGKMPIALTKESWKEIRDHEMDINAQMPKGDFSVILLAGFAKKASGKMDFSAHIGGTLDSPVLSMDLDLLNCQIDPGMITRSIDDISGRIKVRDNKLAVYDLNGRVGQGRVFITSPPIEQSKMVLDNFIPQYLDFRVQTLGDHGVWLSIPSIMKPGEWGEVHFYGATREDPLLIRGALSELHVIGTALLDTGHYTFPPDDVVDEKGEKIEYRELAGVFFELRMVSGKDCWYKNDFNTNYMEVKVDPENEITIWGKDSDRTPEEAGIKCVGTAGSKQGWLRYLGHQFKLESATLFISKGKLPTMWGRASDKFRGVQIVSAGSARSVDMDVWVDFKGTFGKIDFKLDSSPRFSSTDPDIQQKLILSYLIFNQDMTGYTSQQLKSYYQQNVGQAANDAILQTFDRIASNEITRAIRPFTQNLTGGDINFKQSILSSGSSGVSNTGVSQVVAEPTGNSVVGSSVPLAQVEFSKPLDQRLTFKSVVGAGKNSLTDLLEFQGEIGLQYELRKNLTLNLMTGGNEVGQQETSFSIGYRAMLPDIMGPKAGDKEAPKFVRLDVYPLAPGKFQIIYETDKVTRGEVRIMDADKKVVQENVEKTQQSYDHQLVVDKLNPEDSYQIQIMVKDLNQNQAVTIQQVSGLPE